MGPVAEIRASFGKYAIFRGRARRAEFWWTLAFVSVVSMAASALDWVFFGPDGARIVAPLWGLVTALPMLAVTARRLHDYDLSGWWMLLALVPVVGIIFVLFVAALPGTEGDNRFGNNPMEIKQE